MSKVTITYAPHITFHPKVFLFKGKKLGTAFLGSNNLTVGGLETNFEATVRVDYELPSEHAEHALAEELIACLHPGKCAASFEVSAEVLKELEAGKHLMDEESSETRKAKKKLYAGVDSLTKIFDTTKFKVVPPSSIPADLLKAQKKKVEAKKSGIKASKGGKQASPVLGLIGDVTGPLIANPNGFVIVINTRGNGEIHLSYSAVKQYPKFFEWPFKGLTTPKKGTNDAYPARIPSPIIDLSVIGENDAVLLSKQNFRLNTVDYTKNREIRVTIGGIDQIVRSGSVMVMKHSPRADVDYDVVIHTPESSEFQKWIDLCNQTMPSGGLPQARRFGWF